MFQLVVNSMVDAPSRDINRVALSQIVVSIPLGRQASVISGEHLD